MKLLPSTVCTRSLLPSRLLYMRDWSVCTEKVSATCKNLELIYDSHSYKSNMNLILSGWSERECYRGPLLHIYTNHNHAFTLGSDRRPLIFYVCVQQGATISTASDKVTVRISQLYADLLWHYKWQHQIIPVTYSMACVVLCFLSSPVTTFSSLYLQLFLQ